MSTAHPAGADGEATGPGPVSQARQTLALLRDAIGAAAGRFGLIVAVSVTAAILESAALVVLPVLLLGGPASRTHWGSALAETASPIGLVALYLGLVGVGSALLYVQAVATERLTTGFGTRLRLRLHEAVMRAGWGTAALARPTDLVHALTAEAGQSAVAVRAAISLGACLIQLPLLLAAAFVLSPGLATAALVLAALSQVPFLPIVRRGHRLAAVLARISRQMHGQIADELAGLKTLKMLRAEEARGEALRARLAEVGEAQLDQTRAMASLRGGRRVATAAVALAGAYWGLNVLRLDAASMLALALALTRLAGQASAAGDHWRQLGRMLPVYRQLRDSEERCRTAGEPVPAPAVPRLRRELRLGGLAFAYPGSAERTLDAIDLVLPARSITAVTGPSGAGKSTLADLVMGLLTPGAGTMAIDGVALEAAARVAWRERVAYVPQELFLFHDTVRANLRIAKQDATEAELRAALEAAAADFVLHLPDGLDTIVGERGGRLSGGERQRLMLARALLRDPDLLVLDEATSALDPVSEAAVIASLRLLAARMTILVIAHRPTMIEAADHVVHLVDGRIVPGRPPSPAGGGSDRRSGVG